MGQKGATAHKINSQQTTTLLGKLKFKQRQAVSFHFTTNSDKKNKEDKKATRDILNLDK